MFMIEHKIALVSIDRVRPHECVVEERVRELLRDLVSLPVLRKPVVVDEETLTLLDGHHRLKALRRLGVELIPAALVKYSDPRIVVRRWGSGEIIEKRLVVERAMEGRLFPPKTTRHLVALNGGEVHISEVVPEVNVHLKDLLEYSVLRSELKAMAALAAGSSGGAAPTGSRARRRGISPREKRRTTPPP